MSASKPRKWDAGCWRRKRGKLGSSLKKIPEEDLQRVASEYGCGRIEDLYADLGYGKWSARQVIAKAHAGSRCRKPAEEEKQPKTVRTTVKRMLGMDDGDDSGARARRSDGVPRRSAAIRFRETTLSVMSRAGAALRCTARFAPTWRTCCTSGAAHRLSSGRGSTQATFPVRLADFHRGSSGNARRDHRGDQRNGANIRTFESGGEGQYARADRGSARRARSQASWSRSSPDKRIPGVFDIERVYNV